MTQCCSLAQSCRGPGQHQLLMAFSIPTLAHTAHSTSNPSPGLTASGLSSSCSAVGKSFCFRSWKQSRDFPREPDKPGLATGNAWISVKNQHLRQRWIYVEGKGFRNLSCGQLDLMRQLLLWRFHSQSSSPAGMG